MKSMRRLLFTVLVATAFFACTRDESRLVEKPSPGTKPEELSNAVAGTAVIKVDDVLLELLEAAGDGAEKTKSEDVNEALRAIGIKSFSRVFPYAGEYEQRTREAGLHRFYLIEYDESIPTTKAGDMLGGIEGVTNVEIPHKVHRRSAVPNDPYFKWQWDMYNDKSLDIACRQAKSEYGIEKFNNNGADMNLMSVWENYSTGNSSVIVDVVDGGVDLNHPDLAGIVIPGGSNGSKNFVKNSYNITPDSHGTHVAGTIAAIRNNGVGVAGIAGGDYAKGITGVRILSSQIFDGNYGASDQNTANAIKWGADHGAIISQNSWGEVADTNEDGEVSASELAAYKKTTLPSYLKEAIDYFIQFAGCESVAPYNQKADSPMKGGIVVFAAGNEDIDYDPYCVYDKIIAVGAGTAGYTRAYYSNYGSWVDICAPGGDGLYNGYVNACDTQTFYDDYGAYRYSRGQIYNLYASVSLADYDYKDYGYMSGTSMACPHICGALALIASYFGGPGFTNDDCTKLLLDGANKNYINNNKYVGPWVDLENSFMLGIPASTVPPDKVAEFSLEAVRKTINISFKVPADADDGKPNTVLCLYGTKRSAVENSTPSAIASGVSSEVFNIGDIAAGGTVNGTLGEHSYSTTYYVKLYSSDLSKNWSEASEVKSITTPDNHAPVVNAPIDGVLLYGSGTGKNITLSALFSDPDGDPLTLTCRNSDGKIINISYDNNMVRIKALAGGTADVTVTASDGEKTASYTFPVLVKADVSNPAETFPTPVTTDLVIRTEEPTETYVRIVSASGKVVYEETKVFSGFDPLIVNFTGLAPGRYYVTISYNGKTYNKTIVKV